MQAHTQVRVVLTEETIEISAPPGLAIVAPHNDFWNVYDLDGIAHVFNWKSVAYLTVEQVPASAEGPPPDLPLSTVDSGL